MTLPPSSMKEFNIYDTGVKIDVAAIEWPANATALVYEGMTQTSADALVCRTADPDESKEGAETSEIRIKFGRDQVIGTSSAVLRNDIIRMRTHEGSAARASSFLIFSFSSLLPSLSQVPSTSSCFPRACRK